MRSKADETLVIVETLICLLKIGSVLRYLQYFCHYFQTSTTMQYFAIPSTMNLLQSVKTQHCTEKWRNNFFSDMSLLIEKILSHFSIEINLK